MYKRVLSCVLVLLFFASNNGAAQEQSPVDLKQYPWDLRPRKCLFPGVAEKAGKLCEAVDWETFSETKSRVDSLFVINVDFDLIGRAENELGFSDKQFSDGTYYFDAWYLSLLSQFTNAGNPQYEQLLRQWQRAKGKNAYSSLAEALMRHAEAWRARGAGYSNKVLPEAWAIYRRKLHEANSALDAASERLKRMGPWYALKLQIGFELNELENDRARLFNEASDAWPDYHRIYSLAMIYSQPKWGGTYEEVDRIARLAIKKTKSRLGAAMYAELYDTLMRFSCDCVVTDTKSDWGLLKQGFRDSQSHGRAGPVRLQRFANLACHMRDREEAQRLYVEVDKLKQNKAPEAPDPCRIYAFAES